MKITFEGSRDDITRICLRVGQPLPKASAPMGVGFDLETELAETSPSSRIDRLNLIVAATNVVSLVNGRDSYSLKDLYARVDALNAAMPHPLPQCPRDPENQQFTADEMETWRRLLAEKQPSLFESAARVLIDEIADGDDIPNSGWWSVIRNRAKALHAALPARAKEGEVEA